MDFRRGQQNVLWRNQTFCSLFSWRRPCRVALVVTTPIKRIYSKHLYCLRIIMSSEASVETSLPGASFLYALFPPSYCPPHIFVAFSIDVLLFRQSERRTRCSLSPLGCVPPVAIGQLVCYFGPLCDSMFVWHPTQLRTEIVDAVLRPMFSLRARFFPNTVITARSPLLSSDIDAYVFPRTLVVEAYHYHAPSSSSNSKKRKRVGRACASPFLAVPFCQRRFLLSGRLP